MKVYDKCPKCGKETINGLCLDCGMTQVETELTVESIGEEKTDSRYSTEADPLDDVAAPAMFTLDGEDIKPVVKPKYVLPTFINPYADVIPFERPDFGDAYAPPQTVVLENGAPVSLKYDSRRTQLISEKLKISSGRKVSEYWWIIFISAILPWQISWLPAMAMLRFDEKGGRLAGGIMIVFTVIKFFISGILE